MPTFRIDGRDIPFEPGETVIRAAFRQGIEIPHYCWHPGLSVAANCRMCLVEVKSQRPIMMPILKWDPAKNDYVEANKPKLVPACQQTAAEGMEVLTQSDNVREAQGAVQEFLLLNHPVDCPICDQAGECKLQDYWLSHQATLKRKDTEPVHKPKAVRFGPTIVYDAERCIMCTRCIRFCDEVIGDHVLDMRERGNRNEIVLSPGRELDNDYTLMTEHVCPVGALTSRDFRFKARVWFLRAAPNVCSGCATGCNDFIDYDPRQNRVHRLRPRDNMDVNQFWMCDDGMMSYHRFHENRIVVGRVRHGYRPAGAATDVSPSAAIAAAAESLTGVDGSRIGIVLSAQHSTEDNFVLSRFGREGLRSERFYLAALPGWRGDSILRNSDNNPNRKGATLAASGPLGSTADLLRDVAERRLDAVIALGWATAENAEQLGPLTQLKSLVCLTSNEGPLPSLASVLIPVCTHAETGGSFINAKGMTQKFQRAVTAPPGVLPAWQALLEIARQMQHTLNFAEFSDVQRALAPELTRSGTSEAQAL